MQQKVTVKVVSQKSVLEYHGVGTKNSLVAASKMRSLLNLGNSDKGARAVTAQGNKSSSSFTLFESKPTREGEEVATIEGALTFNFELVLTKLKSFEELEATRKRAEFFETVENGKKSLIEKFGKRIPNDEILKLAQNLKPKSITIWKHQVITTVTSDTEFRGSHKTREGRFTSSVKSKTVYTIQPLTEAQLEELKALLSAEKDSTTKLTASRVSRGRYTTWETKASGKVLFRELSQSSDLET